MIEKVKRNIKKIAIVIIVVLLITMILTILLFLLILMFIDIKNYVVDNSIFENFLNHMSEIYWLALWGFIITLSSTVIVPLAFYVIGERHRNNDKIDNKIQLDRIRQKETEDRILNHLPVDLASSIIRYVYGKENKQDTGKEEFINYNEIFVVNNKVRERENITGYIDQNWNKEKHYEQIIEYNYEKFLAVLTEFSRSKDNMQKAYEIIKTIHSFENNDKYKMKYKFVMDTLEENVKIKDKYIIETNKKYNERELV